MSALYWIRKDLRLDDNPALIQALSQGCKQAIFISTPHTWQRHNVAPIQVDFMARHLAWFEQQLNAQGVELTVINGSDFNAQIDQLLSFCSEHQITRVFANSQLEIDEVDRDKQVAARIELNLFEADVMLPKGSVLNKQGEMFKVYTPFKKAWLQAVKQSGFDQSYLGNLAAVDVEFDEHKFSFDYPKVESSKWPLADTALRQVLPRFLAEKHDDYELYRDRPDLKATSGLSPYLAIGAISPKRVFIELINHMPNVLEDMKAPQFSWLNELIWREFYRHLLDSFPSLSKNKDFQEKFRGFKWPDHQAKFELWCNAQTGFPIVDAAMKQLKQTGWMHNRLRMIVASFLTKHLLVDWRKGEAFFMQHLIDGDLAANNGGWQWAAGTGCDAQPYFRIFNPLTQSEKFDPNGDFIRKYLPELANVPTKHIHEPQAYLAATGQSDVYPDAIVDLKEARNQALEYYKSELS